MRRATFRLLHGPGQDTKFLGEGVDPALSAPAFAAAATLFVLFGPLLAEREHEKHVVRGQPGSEITAPTPALNFRNCLLVNIRICDVPFCAARWYHRLADPRFDF